MRQQCLILMLLASTSLAHCQEQVFVDLGRLASLHPAWLMAERIRGERKRLPMRLLPQSFPLTEVPLSLSLPQPKPFFEWATELKQTWENEVNLIQSRQLQIAAWQLQLAIPPLPLVDPISRWKFVVQQKEKQGAERVRLNLRLAFSDLLPAEERAALEKRRRELDAVLEPPSVSLPPIFLPISPPQQPDLTVPQNLTDPKTILNLVSPLPLPPQISLMLQIPSEMAEATPKLLTANIEAILRLVARKTARAFILAYARERGWKVTFERRAETLDVTEEVLAAWKGWLERMKTKE